MPIVTAVMVLGRDVPENRKNAFAFPRHSWHKRRVNPREPHVHDPT